MSDKKDDVWKKAKEVDGKDPKKFRLDPYGKEMYYNSYGKCSEKGWQVDHIKPKQKGGGDNIKNLQALNSHINMSKGASLIKKSRHNQK